MRISTPEKNTYLVHLEKGEPIIASLTDFAKQHKISMAQVTGIGGVANIELGCFDIRNKEFKSQMFADYSELLHADGNISILSNGEPYVHLHASLANSQFQAYGGHLFEAMTEVVCEFFVYSQVGHLQRQYNQQLKIEQWQLHSCCKALA